MENILYAHIAELCWSRKSVLLSLRYKVDAWSGGSNLHPQRPRTRTVSRITDHISSTPQDTPV